MLKIAQHQQIDIELLRDNGDGAVMLGRPYHHRFCIALLREWVCWQWEGWWQKSELVRTPQKKGPLTLRGKATEGDALGSIASGTGEMQDDATGQGHGRDASSSLSPSILRRVSLRVGVLAVQGVVAEVRTVSTWQKRKSPTHLEGNASGSMASETGGMQEDTTSRDPGKYPCLRGQDGTGLDGEKKEPGEGGERDQSGQKKKASEGHSLTHVKLPRTWEKKEGRSATGQYMGKASKYGTHQWIALGDVVLEMAVAMTVVREKYKSGHQEKASK